MSEDFSENTGNVGSDVESETDYEDSDGEDAVSDDESGDDSQVPQSSNYVQNQPFTPSIGTFVDPKEFLSPSKGVSAASTPLEIFRKFMTDDILEDIILETNRYAEQEAQKKPGSFKCWKNVESDELWQFIALTFMMGIIKKPAIRDYWAKEELFSTPSFGRIMPRNRYQEILRGLHFVDNETIESTNTNRFHKLGSFLTSLTSGFEAFVCPGKNLCIDETLLPFQGRLSIKQFNPLKRGRFGMKMFLLCDALHKFVLRILPYQGKATAIEDRGWIEKFGFGGAAVMTLLGQYFHKFYRVTIDNWFMSPTLALALKAMGTYVLGTVQKRRKLMPKMLGKLKKGAVETHSTADILIERWSDRREVVMLNTFMGHEMVESVSSNPSNTRSKPATVLQYNLTMNAVDTVDQVTRPYTCVRKSFKWYKKVAFYLFDITAFNSMRIYYTFRTKSEQPSYKFFIETLIREILIQSPPANRRTGPAIINVDSRLLGKHLPQFMYKIITGEDGRSKTVPIYSNCYYCSLEGLRSTSSYECSLCKRRFCVKERNCFYKFHTVRHLPHKNSSYTRTVNLQYNSVTPLSSSHNSQIHSQSILSPAVIGNHDSEVPDIAQDADRFSEEELLDVY